MQTTNNVNSSGQMILNGRRIVHLDDNASDILELPHDTLLGSDFIAHWKADVQIQDLARSLVNYDTFQFEAKSTLFLESQPVQMKVVRQEHGMISLVNLVSNKMSSDVEEKPAKTNPNIISAQKQFLCLDTLLHGVCILSSSLKYIYSNKSFDSLVSFDRDIASFATVKPFTEVLQRYKCDHEKGSYVEDIIELNINPQQIARCVLSIGPKVENQSTITISLYKLEKQPELTFKEVKNRYGKIINKSTGGAAIINLKKDETGDVASYTIVSANELFCELIGVQSSRIQNKHFSKSNGVLEEFWLHLFAENGKSGLVQKGRYIDEKTQKVLEYIVTPMGIDTVFVSLNDISYQIVADKKTHNSGKMYRQITDKSPDLIIQYSPKYDITYLNDSAFLLLKQEKESYKDISATQAIHVSQSVFRRIKVVERTKETEYVVESRNGKEQTLYLFWSISPILDEDGKVTSFLTTGRDISILKQREAELLSAKDKAEELDRLKTAFLANMSHEIRTPLNGMIGFAQLVKVTPKSSPDYNYFLRTIEDNGHKLLAIINDILDLSKIEAGRISMLKSPFDANSMIQDLFKLFEIKLENEQSEVEFVLAVPNPAPECILFSDEGRIRQVLSNLIDNAIKFTKQGQIVVGYYLTDEKDIHFYVSDTGLGIRQEDQQLIFARFRQAHPDHLNPYGGSGLGLSISKKYVEMLGGEIRLNSELGRGTTFYVSFPTSSLEEVEIDRNKEEKPNCEVDWNQQTVLIVEDDPDAFFLISRHLDETNINIVHAENGKRAMELFLNTNVDLILMDIRLPDTDGYAVTEWIRNQGSDLPIIFQSANVLNNDHKKSLEIGGNAFLPKPYSAEQLIQEMHQFLG